MSLSIHARRPGRRPGLRGARSADGPGRPPDPSKQWDKSAPRRAGGHPGTDAVGSPRMGQEHWLSIQRSRYRWHGADSSSTGSPTDALLAPEGARPGGGLGRSTGRHGLDLALQWLHFGAMPLYARVANLLASPLLMALTLLSMGLALLVLELPGGWLTLITPLITLPMQALAFLLLRGVTTISH